MERTIKKLRIIASKTASQVTNDDKAFIRNLAPKYGVELPKDKPNCKSCYVDASIAIYKAIKESQSVEKLNTPKVEKASEKKHKKPLKLMERVDVIWRGIRINAASATPENLEKWVADGFPTIFCE